MFEITNTWDFPLGTCCWCSHNYMRGKESIWMLSAKIKDKTQLPAREGGYCAEINIFSIERSIWCIIPAEDSPTKEQGYDLSFIVCSKECSHFLQDELSIEPDLFDFFTHNFRGKKSGI